MPCVANSQVKDKREEEVSRALFPLCVTEERNVPCSPLSLRGETTDPLALILGDLPRNTSDGVRRRDEGDCPDCDGRDDAIVAGRLGRPLRKLFRG